MFPEFKEDNRCDCTVTSRRNAISWGSEILNLTNLFPCVVATKFIG
jgi:hypothetical protein